MDCQSVGTGEPALIYLGRYLYRGVIREADIVAGEGGQVFVRYGNAQSGRIERRTVCSADFLGLVLPHGLPKGFRRARNFGLLHPNCKRIIAVLHVLLKFVPSQATAGFKERASRLCARGGAVMVIVRTRIPPLFSGPIPVPLATVGAR